MPVDERSPVRDPWSLPTFLLWMLFLVMGLGLEPLYYALREYAGVATKTAFINNPLVIQMAMAIYFTRFAYLRARETRPDVHPWDYAMPLMVLLVMAMAAFWWLPYELALQLDELQIPNRFWTFYVITGVSLAALLKTLCWLHMLSLVFRYYVLDRADVFAKMFGMLPRKEEDSDSATVLELGNSSSEWEKIPAEPRKEPVD